MEKQENSDLKVENIAMPMINTNFPQKRHHQSRFSVDGNDSHNIDATLSNHRDELNESESLMQGRNGPPHTSDGYFDLQKDVELGTPSKLVRMSKASSQALLSGLSYCISSCSMILLNKLVLSSFKWEAQITLMLYQNFVSVFVVLFLARTKLIEIDPIGLDLIRIWFPVNFIFVGMLVTSFFSLQFLQVAMVMVLKNMTNLLTAVGEIYLFGKHHSSKVWASLFLMVISSVCGGITDLSFHPVGYFWQLLNCLFTSGYSLTLRRVMDKAKAATPSGKLSEFTMVLLNNLLSFPLGLALVFVFGELNYVVHSPLLHSGMFWLCASVSGLMGLAISFSSMWFLHETGPTTFSLVGSLNKLPLSIAGIVIFKAPMSLPNLGSILFGCFAGVLFARAKLEK